MYAYNNYYNEVRPKMLTVTYMTLCINISSM